MDLRSIGQNIRTYRTAKGLRQEDLAERAGLSVNYVGALERGEKIPSLETFIILANALEVSADMLLCDVVRAASPVRASLLARQAEQLRPEDQAQLYAVVEAMLRHMPRSGT